MQHCNATFKCNTVTLTETLNKTLVEMLINIIFSDPLVKHGEHAVQQAVGDCGR